MMTQRRIGFRWNYFWWSIFVMSSAGPSLAVPEAARYGYFQCVSCHVSPGGGGLLTPYGRSFAAEKLSTWSYKKEENPLHGLLPNSERILLGGDIRVAHLDTKRGGKKYVKTWRMQMDGDLGVHYGPVWASVTVGQEPRGPEERPDAKKGALLRAAQLRVDLMDDQILIRGGRFTPRHGLGLVDHTAFVRQAALLPAEAEQDQVEAIYQQEFFEVGGAAILKREGSDRSIDYRSGFSSQVSLFLLGKHRLTGNWLNFNYKRDLIEQVDQIGTLSTVLTLTKKLWYMGEITRVMSENKFLGKTLVTHSLATYSLIGFELYQGVETNVVHEHLDYDTTKKDTSVNRYALGLTLRPRPHFAVSGKLSRTFDNTSESTRDAFESIFHYYL